MLQLNDKTGTLSAPHALPTCQTYRRPVTARLGIVKIDRGEMTSPLLTTKFYIPPIQPGFVSRPRLIERLNEGQHRKLTLVSAPAGFGKTTLVSDWLHRQKVKDTPSSVAWLSLDEGDNDAARFLTYVAAALQMVESRLGETTLLLLQSSQVEAAPPLENIITVLINDLATLPARTTLVLDDYHVINNLEIHKALTFLVSHLPPQLHLVIISREDPMLPLHRLRARGQMTEIHAKDLRFTVDEAALFLNQTMGLHLAPNDIAALEQRTEGWIAGLQLAALSIRDVADAGEFVAAFAGDDRYVVDYLIAEVLDSQPPHIQDFLMRTAILHRFTASLCDTVLGQESSRDILTQLEQANLFLVPLDNKREWYRYHRLFGDLLRYRLREQVEEQDVRRLHQRAAAWYIQNDFFDEAVHHSLAAEDFAQATDLADLICADLVEQSQFQKLLSLVAALPDDLVRTHPRLCAYHAWTLGATGELDAIPSRLEDAERALPTTPPALARVVQGQIATLRAYDARHRQDLIAAIEFLHQALQYLPPDSLRERILANANLGVNYLTLGQLDRARKALQTARTEGLSFGRAQTWIAIGATSYLADTYVVEGQLGQATQLYREAIAQGLDATSKHLLPVAGHACAGLGRVLYEQGKVDEARRYLHQGIELSELIGFWGSVLKALIPLAWLEQMQGNRSVAKTVLQQALDLAKRIRHSWANGWMDAYLSAYRTRLWLAQATPNLTAAVRWAETYQRGEPDITSYPEEFAQLTLTRVELAIGQSSQALARLEMLAEAAAAGRRNDSLIKILILQALAQTTQGANAKATDTLNRALDLAAPESYCRTFFDEGPEIIHLLRSSRHPYAAQLLQSAESLTQAPLTLPTPDLEEALNEREIKVLRLFAAGLSNAEIAQEMFFSVNTIKWYAKNIYRKLNVNRRAQAIAQARKLGLIP